MNITSDTKIAIIRALENLDCKAFKTEIKFGSDSMKLELCNKREGYANYYPTIFSVEIKDECSAHALDIAAAFARCGANIVAPSLEEEKKA